MARGKRFVLPVIVGMLWALAVPGPQAVGQTKKESVTLTKAQILEGAKKEAKLTVSPAFDEKSIPIMVKAFEKKYPFIKVSWTSADGIPAYQRQLFELSAAAPIWTSSALTLPSGVNTLSRTW